MNRLIATVNQRKLLLRFIIFFIISLLVLSTILFILLNTKINNDVELTIMKQKSILELLKRNIEFELEDVISDLKILKGNKAVNNFLYKQENECNICGNYGNNTEETIINFLQSKNRYREIILIDSKGDEKLKIERDIDNQINKVSNSEIEKVSSEE